jgi:hypothetical protein
MRPAGAALRTGLRWVWSSPKLILWLWLLNLAFALPLAAVVSEAIHESVRTSLVAADLEHGVDAGWFAEFEGDATGVAATFEATMLGAGGFLRNLDDWWSGRLFAEQDSIVVAGIAYTFLWAMALGGALAHFARGAGRLTARRFAADAGRTFFRFVRLGALSAVLYYGVFRFALWLFPVLERATRDVTVEGRVLLVFLAGAALVIALLAVVNVISGYAKIAIVREDLSSVLAAWAKAARLVVRNPGRVALVYLALTLLAAAWLVVVSVLPTGASVSSWVGVIAMIGVGQVAIAGRLAIRMCFYASETALYRATA